MGNTLEKEKAEWILIFFRNILAVWRKRQSSDRIIAKEHCD